MSFAIPMNSICPHTIVCPHLLVLLRMSHFFFFQCKMICKGNKNLRYIWVAITNGNLTLKILWILNKENHYVMNEKMMLLDWPNWQLAYGPIKILGLRMMQMTSYTPEHLQSISLSTHFFLGTPEGGGCCPHSPTQYWIEASTRCTEGVIWANGCTT